MSPSRREEKRRKRKKTTNGDGVDFKEEEQRWPGWEGRWVGVGCSEDALKGGTRGADPEMHLSLTLGHSLHFKIIFTSLVPFCISQSLWVGEEYILFSCFTDEKTEAWRAPLICSWSRSANLFCIWDRLFLAHSKFSNCFPDISFFLKSQHHKQSIRRQILLYFIHPVTISIFLLNYNFSNFIAHVGAFD